jgi:hypothetical protein
MFPVRELMDLFRAVLVSGEKSQRVLELIEELLETNPANYTIWSVPILGDRSRPPPVPPLRQYRRQVLSHLQIDLREELDYMDSFADDNPKNYQIWFHRRSIVERSGDPSRELAFTAAVFEVDSKNYHAWSHRSLRHATVTCLTLSPGNGSSPPSTSGKGRSNLWKLSSRSAPLSPLALSPSLSLLALISSH